MATWFDMDEKGNFDYRGAPEGDARGAPGAERGGPPSG